MRSRSPIGWLVGVLSAGVAVAVGELVAAFVRPAASPVIAVGNGIIVLTPESLKRPAIDSVGTNDKTLLIAGILVLVGVLGAAIGGLAIRSVYAGLGGVAVLGGFAAYCAVIAKGSRATDVVPTAVGSAVAAGVLVTLVRLAGGPGPEAAGDAPLVPNRRLFLQGSLAVAVVAALAGFAGRSAQGARYNVAAARRRIKLPAAIGDDAMPVGADLGKSGVPWATPNNRFYRIDTALVVPQIDPDHWRLRIHGMVDREISLTYRELLTRPMVDRWITLSCVSNPVGGPLVGNALFRGTPLADVLRAAGIHPDADQLLLHSDDGYTFGAPTAVVMDGREGLLAVGMNGEVLPVEHGFPARTVVPGLYGYVSACKWIVEIEATTFAAKEAYWVQGGWAAQPSIQLASRIDTPRPHSAVRVGEPVAVAGVAWDQHVGVSRVEVQVDEGPWLVARLATVPSTDTWRQWYATWTPERSGDYQLRVRAVDAAGVPQTADRQGAFPSGATGLHTVSVRAVG